MSQEDREGEAGKNERQSIASDCLKKWYTENVKFLGGIMSQNSFTLKNSI